MSVSQSHSPFSEINSWKVCSLIVIEFESRLNHPLSMRKKNVIFFNIFMIAPYLRKGF
jgi:hypothetical protein